MTPNRSLYAAAIIALSAAALLPVQSMAQVGVNLVIGNAPPPPRFESVPHARRGYVWAPGYWNWDGHRHVWSAGHWEPERRGASYRRPEWVRDGQRWRLNQGGWVMASAPRVDYTTSAPPPLRHELLPPPRSGYVWNRGHWEWRGQRHVWVAGAWLAERPGYVYRPAAWSQRGGRWYLEQGRWAGQGDRDHDGIPNRVDRHDDRGGHDRDHDGVPNRRDQHPDNQRRH